MYKSAAEKRAEKSLQERFEAWKKQNQDRGIFVTSENEIMILDDQINLVGLAWRRGAYHSDPDVVAALKAAYDVLKAKREARVSQSEFYRMERQEGKYEQFDNVITIAELQRQAKDRKVIK